MRQLMRLMGCVIVMNYCASVYYMNSFSPMESVGHKYTIHLQIFHIVIAHWLCIFADGVQSSLWSWHWGWETTTTSSATTHTGWTDAAVVESQRMLAEAMRRLVNRDERHVRQGPEPNQYSSFKDFMDTKPPIFREAKEPLQADEWLSTIEQRFHLLWLTESMKASYAGHQL
jgi:hypothetical protein